MADSGPYWMRIKIPDTTEVDCYDEEVHSYLEVATRKRRGFLPVVTTIHKPDVVPPGMRIRRHFYVDGDSLIREYHLDPIPMESEA